MPTDRVLCSQPLAASASKTPARSVRGSPQPPQQTALSKQDSDPAYTPSPSLRKRQTKTQAQPRPGQCGQAMAYAPDPARMPPRARSASRYSRSHAPSASRASTTPQFPAKECTPVLTIQDSASDNSD